MKRILVLLICLLLLTGCAAPVSAGVSQEEYDKIVAERDALQARLAVYEGGDGEDAEANLSLIDTGSAEPGLSESTTANDEFQALAYEDIARTPDNYVGAKAKFTGEIIQVVADSTGVGATLRANVTKVGSSYRDTIYVIYPGMSNNNRILENDIVTMYGVMDGMETYETIMGGSMTIPKFLATSIEQYDEAADAEAATVGSRTMPAPIGQAVDFDLSSYSGDGSFTITINEVLRGNEAWEVVKEGNRYNEKPEDGELLLFNVTLVLNAWSDEEAYDAYSGRFEYFDSSYSEISTEFYSAVFDDKFGAEIYEGGTAKGWIYCVVPKDEDSPLARFDDSAWFCLYGDNSAPAEPTDSDPAPRTASLNGEDINLRAGPGTDYDVVGKVGEPSSATILGEDGDWYEVSIDGMEGYLREDFVTLD